MTARMVSCRDLTENEADLKKLGELFSGFQASTTPASLLLPWFPSAARDAKREATTGLFTILYGYVERRRHAEPTSDALDVLIADGETTEIIVGVSRRSCEVLKSDPTILVCHGRTVRWCP